MLFQSPHAPVREWHNASWITGPEAGYVNVSVIINDLGLTYYYEVAKPKVQILLNSLSLIQNLSKFFTSQPYFQKPLLKFCL